VETSATEYEVNVAAKFCQQVWLSSAPQIQASKTWFRMIRGTLGCLWEPHTEPQIRRSYGYRAIERGATGPSPGTPIGRASLATILNLLRSHVDPPFRQSLHRNRLSCWRSISRHVSAFASHGLTCLPRSIGFVRSLTCVSSQEGVDTAA
jgi:hypothetical protein